LRFWRPALYQLSYTPTPWQPWRAALPSARPAGPFSLFDNFGDDAGADGSAALADGEAQALVHGDRLDQLHFHLHVVARHHHLRALRQRHRPRHVRRPEVELRTVVREERRVPTALLLGQNVRLALEPRVRRDRSRRRQNLTPLNLLALRAPQQHTDVVPRLALVQKLAEHLNARAHRLHRRAQTDDLDLVANLDDATLDPARHNRATARDREHVLDRHQKRLVLRTLRLRNVLVHRLHQIQDRLLPDLLVTPLQRRQRRTPDHRYLVPRKLVRRQKLPNLQLHKVQKLRVVHHVHLVHEHHKRRNPSLPRQKNVLPRLRHRAVRRRHNQDRPVHLRRP